MENLSKVLAGIVCEALNDDVPAEDCMRALRDTENKLAAFMLSDPPPIGFMAALSCTHH